MLLAGILCSVAGADPIGAGSGAILRLTPETTFQQGCFPPCLCPLTEEKPAIGVMKVVYAGQVNGLHVYSVQDVNWRVDSYDPPLHVFGSGVYRIGNPNAVTVVQHRLELQLNVGGNASAAFDSGWINLTQNAPGQISVSISMNGQYCFDQVFDLHAARVPGAQVQEYALDGGSTFQFGCFWFCDCASEMPRPMIGEFALVEIASNPLFTDYAVADVQWIALHPDMAVGTLLNGFGFYRRGGEVAVQHQMTLHLAVDDRPRARFDSGWVGGGGEYPAIDIDLEHNPNDCVGTLLHVAAKPKGEVCGGFIGIPCDDANDFCKTPIGECCCDFLGICTPTGGSCPAVWDPVCGCDHVTYPSECDADSAGVSIQHYGPCGSQCGLPGDPPCGNDSFCQFPIGDCGGGNIAGTCTPIPLGCPDIWDPVCGCDGVTYGNECDAAAAGVSIAHHGSCEQVCGGIQGIPCPPGEFCRFPIGTCDVSDNQGICRAISGACPAVWDPVCGCDGVTYGNRCEADAAQAQVDHEGACLPNCAATRSLISNSSLYCPGSPTLVRIGLSPPNGAAAIAIEDVPPAGWTVNNVSDGGFYDAAAHTVRWGPFFAPFPAEVSYSILPGNDTAGPKCFAGVISIDGQTEAICGASCLQPCCPRMAADRPQEACDGCPVSGCNFCSNSSCADGRISLCEVIGYACSWLRGCHDDISGVTRAAHIWRNGECYCWSDQSSNWMPRTCSPAIAPCCENAGAAVSSADGLAGMAVVTTVPQPALHGRRAGDWKVIVDIKAPPGTSASAMELQLPKTWRVVSAGEGMLDEVNGKLKWGPFMDPASRSLTFVVHAGGSRATSDKLNRIGPPDPAAIRGLVSFDGVSRPITTQK